MTIKEFTQNSVNFAIFYFFIHSVGWTKKLEKIILLISTNMHMLCFCFWMSGHNTDELVRITEMFQAWFKNSL